MSIDDLTKLTVVDAERLLGGTATHYSTRSFAFNRLLNILREPNGGWGAPQAVELQVLLLVELCHVAVGVPRESVDGTQARFQAFIFAKLGTGGPQDLAGTLKLTDSATDEFTRILKDFVTSELSIRPSDFN
jgi:hypothetical protein